MSTPSAYLLNTGGVCGHQFKPFQAGHGDTQIAVIPALRMTEAGREREQYFLSLGA